MLLPRTPIQAVAVSLVGRRPTLCALLLLLGLVVVCAVSVHHDTVTFDEAQHLGFGARLVNGDLRHADMQRMPVTALNVVPRNALRAFDVSFSPALGLYLSRLPTILCTAVLGWFIFAWSRRLYGTSGGLLSLFLFVFCPTSVAHGRLITTDMYCALFFFVAVLTFRDYLKTPSWPRLLAAAVMNGAAQLSKQTALLLFPVLLAVLVLHWYATWQALRASGELSSRHMKAAARRGASHTFRYLLITLVVINAGYWFAGTFGTVASHREWLQANVGYVPPRPPATGLAKTWDDVLSRTPVPLPAPYVEAFLLGQYYNETGEGHGPAYLLGKTSPLGWRYYFPVAFLLKTPLPTLALVLIALYVSLRTGRLRLHSDELVLLCAAAAPFVYLSLFCTAQLGVRYLLPVLPFLYVLAGRLAAWRPPRGSTAWKASLATLLFWLAASTSSYFPHYIAYFNEICWNRLSLYKYLADSNLDWGQSGYYLDRYLERHQGRGIAVSPESVTAGKTIIVGVNDLLGLGGVDPAKYRALREEHAPTSHIAYSWLVYQLPPPPPK